MVWLDRTLLLGPRLALVTSEKGYRKVLREIGVVDDPHPFCEPHWHGCTHSFDTDDGLVCVVALQLPAIAARDPIGTAALLVHEAVHVWQRTRAVIGPGECGAEMEAYAIQNISTHLMRAYVKASSSAAASSLA